MENSSVTVPWMWKGRQVQGSDIPEGCVGFVYKIVEIEEVLSESIYMQGFSKWDFPKRVYIGKKALQTNRKAKIGKRAIAAERASRSDGKAKTVKRVVKDSGWMKYNSSCKPLQVAI